MIFKILKAKNIGRLNIPTNDDSTIENENDDFSFKRNTLIFGDNTCGKTTLVSVFKSLQTGEPLENRKKFKSQGQIEIKIKNIIPDEIYEYGKSTWKNKNILIFDSDFINDHVFSEDQIKGEHLKSLPKVLIGDGIKQDLDNINSIVRCENNQCNTCEHCLYIKLNEHKSTFGRDYELANFLEINTEISDVDEQIKEKETVLSIDEKLVELKKKSQKSFFYRLNIAKVEVLFDKKRSNVFEAVIEKHLLEKTNNLEKARGFLGYGLMLKKDNICPFCSQDTTNVQGFMDNLSSYFDKKYTEFKNEIEHHSDELLAFDLEKELLSFGSLNFTLIEELFNKEKFEQVIKNIKNKITKKKEDLAFDCGFQNDEDFIFFKDVLLKTRAVLMDVMNKRALEDQEKIRLNQELRNLRLNKYRYSAEGREFYAKYKRVENQHKTKNISKKKAQDALKIKIDFIFKDNLRNINVFLKELKADFQIKKLTTSVDNRDKNNYLKINEYLFEFGDVGGNSTSVETEKFKETFSDSDKRLLGFAFFLSILKNDTHLENKIIILDDPFSSFDINRKEETIKLFDSIKNINEKEPAQKIVFTHEKNFYCQLNKTISSNDKKLLKLNSSTANNGSMLELVDIKKFESDKYYADLDYINNSIYKNNNLDEALPKARECAEYLLKAKYINTLVKYRDKNEKPIDFNFCSVSSFLRVIGDKCLVKDKLIQLELHRFHHNEPQWKTDIPDKAKNQILENFVNLIEEI